MERKGKQDVPKDSVVSSADNPLEAHKVRHFQSL